MVKGVHKKIIEVKSPKGDYFEKAVFYLRPEVSCLPPELAEAAAQVVLEELQPLEHKSLWKKILPVIGAAIVIAGISFCAIILR